MTRMELNPCVDFRHISAPHAAAGEGPYVVVRGAASVAPQLPTTKQRGARMRDKRVRAAVSLSDIQGVALPQKMEPKEYSF